MTWPYLAPYLDVVTAKEESIHVYWQYHRLTSLKYLRPKKKVTILLHGT